MFLSLNSQETGDPVLHSLRSLVARGRHVEAEALARAQKKRLVPGQASVFLALRAEVALGLGRFTAALEWAAEALKNVDPGEAVARGALGSKIRALLGLGRWREAEGFLESRFAFLDSIGIDLNLFRAQVALYSGRLAEATQTAHDACARAVSAGQRGKLVQALLLRAQACRETGEVSRARDDLDRAHRLSNGLRDTSALASVLSDRADLLAHSGDWSEAANNAGQSGRLFARSLSPHEHLSAGRRTGLLGLAKDDPSVALPHIERAADVARRGYGSKGGRAEIHLLLADARLAGRDPEGALERATVALSYFRDAQDQGGLARAHVRRSLAALSASNLTLAHREASIASAIKGAGPVAEGLADLALGRVLLRKDRPRAGAPFDRAARNGGLYPPLRPVAHLGLALANGASPQSDVVVQNLALIEAFGDRRILGIVRSDLRDLFGVEPPSVSTRGATLNSVEPADETEVETGVEPPEFLHGLVGSSAPVHRLSDLVRKTAPWDVPVSIYGETGTGKEGVARAIHALSPRSSRKFVPINAAVLSDELFESEIFGHVRGSFTGAQTDRPGLIEEAKGGTLFIDEVAELSPRSQARLLRVLQDGTYRRVGENHERRADVRVVVAANQRLEDLVNANRFRSDLLYRLQGVCLTVPPLRDRGRDVYLLARHFVTRASEGASRLSQDSEAELRAYVWPGNVRELEQEMRRAVVLAEGPVIEWRHPENLKTPLVDEGSPTPSLQEALGGFERTFLKSVLERCTERVEAARQLGISRQALHQKIVRYGL